MKRKGHQKKKRAKGKKEGEEKKAKVGVCPKKKKDSDGRGLFDSNVFNNQARSLHMSKFVKTW